MPKAPLYETRMVHQAYRVALDPTKEQRQALASHAGARRYIYNWGITEIVTWLQAYNEHGTELPKNLHFALCGAWVKHRDAHANDPEPPEGERRTNTGWVAGSISSSTQQAACRDAAVAWKNFFNSRTGARAGRASGRPKYKKKGRSVESFQVHGNIRLIPPTSTHSIQIQLPKIGALRVLSDDSHHPAFIRSRKRANGNRHIGNRRRIRQLWEQCRDAERKTAIVRDILTNAHGDPGDVITCLNDIATERARQHAAAKLRQDHQAATATLDKLFNTLEKPDLATGIATEALKGNYTSAEITDAAQKAALSKTDTKTLGQIIRVTRRTKRLETAIDQAGRVLPARTAQWTEKKLAETRRTGQLSPQEANDLAKAYHLDETQRQHLVDASAQACIIKATAVLGADGLWWLSIGAEVPIKVRTTPTRKQAARGIVGIDLGVREIATISDGARIRNPRYLNGAKTELAYWQKRMARCVPGSANHAQAKSMVGLINAEVARFRGDAIHRFTTWATRRYAGIRVEGWDVQQTMARGSKDLPRRQRRNRNHALADAGIGATRQILVYKGDRQGIPVTVFDKHHPSGRTCSRCGTVKAKPIPPGDEDFSCDNCGLSMPRRLNTARALAKVSDPPSEGSD